MPTIPADAIYQNGVWYKRDGSPVALTSFTVAQTAVPVILPSDGTLNATGQLTLTTALPSTPVGVVGVYLAANSGLPAGVYQASFSSSTVCQLVGAPATTPGAYATPLAEVVLAAFTIPQGTIGVNDYLRVRVLAETPATATSKVLRLRINGTSISAPAGTSATGLGIAACVRSRGTLGAQLLGSDIVGTATNTLSATALNLNLDAAVTITATLTSGTDFLILDAYTFELVPG